MPSRPGSDKAFGPDLNLAELSPAMRIVAKKCGVVPAQICCAIVPLMIRYDVSVRALGLIPNCIGSFVTVLQNRNKMQ